MCCQKTFAHLLSLTLDDAKELIKYRWNVASKDGSIPLPFNDAAMTEMYRIARGLPRDICSIAGRSLQLAYGAEVKTIGDEIVKAAAVSLKFTV